MNLSHIRHLIQFQHLFLMLCGVEKKWFVDHGGLSIEMNKNLSATDCMKNLKHSLDNAKDCKQKVPVKKHKQSEK